MSEIVYMYFQVSTRAKVCYTRHFGVNQKCLEAAVL
jgi:hypothetical protein